MQISGADSLTGFPHLVGPINIIGYRDEAIKGWKAYIKTKYNRNTSETECVGVWVQESQVVRVASGSRVESAMLTSSTMGFMLV